MAEWGEIESSEEGRSGRDSKASASKNRLQMKEGGSRWDESDASGERERESERKARTEGKCNHGRC